MGSINNIRIVRFLLIVSAVILTIFIYTLYSSTTALAPPAPHANRAASGTDAVMPAALSPDQMRPVNNGRYGDNTLLSIANNNLGSPLVAATLSKLNMKADSAQMAAGAVKAPPSTVKKQHQHREPTIDVDAVNDEVPDDSPDEEVLERFDNELLEDPVLQNIDNNLAAGSINNSNAWSAQQNNAAVQQLQQSKAKQQPQKQNAKAVKKGVNEISDNNANNLYKILDSDVMIPTSNLQKFIENADKILKNITVPTTVNEKDPAKDAKLAQGNEGRDSVAAKGDLKAHDDDNNDIDNDAALPPSVVMTIKRPGSVAQPTETGTKPKTNIKTANTRAPMQAPMKLNSTVPRNNSDHTQGIPTWEIYESGHLNEEINVASICLDKGENLKLLILITSALGHAEARLRIRQTWGHFGSRRDVSTAFVLGRTTNTTLNKALSAENFLYGDMIRGNFIDSYTNLTLKTISTLEWVDLHCRNAKYVLKTDDDMFINVPELLSFINRHAKGKRVIYGRLAKNWKPIRNKKSKYYVSTDQFSPPIFPPFTTGPAYLITHDVIHSLYKRSLLQVYLKLEDVFTTGIVAQQLDIKRVRVNEFFNRRIAFQPCSIRKLISVHMVRPNEQFDLWKKLLDQTTKCK